MEEVYIAMYPWFAVGHFIPYLHLANQLASRGLKICLLLPRNTLHQFQHLNLHKTLITFHPIDVPHIHGLPPGTETVSDIPLSMNHELALAMDLTRPQIKHFLDTAPKLQFVFYDFAYWVPEIAQPLGIKSVCYQIVSAVYVALWLASARSIPKRSVNSESELQAAKNPPIGCPFSAAVLSGHPFLSMPFGEGNISLLDRLTTSLKNCDVLAIRTCRELESKYCDYIESQYENPVWLTGLTLPLNNDDDNSSIVPLEERFAKWMEKFETGSVIFCSFGSQYILKKAQFQELVLGFELSGFPFLIAIKPPEGYETADEALPEGFAERAKGRGWVYCGWVQQPQILGHKSVGCFVHHSGSSSLWESLMSDKQIVMIPRLPGQVLQSRVFAEELKVAVMVDKDENGWFSKEHLSEVIKSVMDKDSEIGVKVKKNHENLKQVLEEPGFINGYIDTFVRHLQEVVLQQKQTK